jgi:hypothetical protein
MTSLLGLADPSFVDSQNLLAAMPIGAAIVVAARTLIGVRTIGVFAPLLVALVPLHLGLTAGAIALFVSLAAGALVIPLAARLALPRVARLGLLLSGSCAGLELSSVGDRAAAGVPVVVLAVLLERTWDMSSAEGWPAGARLVMNTTVIGVLIGVVVAVGPVATLIDSGGLKPVLLGALLVAAAGSYRGLRPSERRRFETLLLAR